MPPHQYNYRTRREPNCPINLNCIQAMKNKEKILKLIEKLKKRNNKSYEFFEDLAVRMDDDSTAADAERRLSTCYSITQYANFTNDEEELLSEIIEEIDRQHKHKKD